ncbi:sulfatase-like hydrolase/transferase [Candidatus Omnitrophota bacterium]
MSIILFSHELKIIFLGAPVSFDDLYSFSALFQVLEPKHAFSMIAPLIVLTILFIVNFKIHKKASLFATSVLCVLVAAMHCVPKHFSRSIESMFAFRSWTQNINYRSSGGTVYLFYETACFLQDRLVAPNRKEVRNALENLDVDTELQRSPSEFQPRNVFVVMMESLWDPLLLRDTTFSQDPFDREFRALWDQCGNSTVMSSTYAGRTANPEFELLTGHPAHLYDTRLMFRRSIKNALPALPMILSDYGYETIAFHPNTPTFFNRFNVYYKLGFDSYYSIEDFNLTDMNGIALSDSELFKQSTTLLESKHENTSPKFIYILTFTGHVPYALNENQRPLFIKSDSKIADVDLYANSIAYSTREAMAFVKYIFHNSPDALLVVLGDHLPFLGKRFAGFVEGGFLADAKEEFTAVMYQDYVSTPIIVIDGNNGPVDVGHISMHETPGVIMKLLQLPRDNLFDAFVPKDNIHIRTLGGMNLVVGQDEPLLCKTGDENEMCKYVDDWQDNITVLDRDLLVGEQFSIEETRKVTLDPLIAHAGGEVQSVHYSNSKEALEESYAKGLRFIELDFNWTSDGHLVLIHDWNRSMETLFQARPDRRSLSEFKKLTMENNLTQLSLDDLAAWLEEHPDVFIVTDIKTDNIKGLLRIKETFPELAHQFVPQVYYFKEYHQARKLGYQHIILTLYIAQYRDEEILTFADNNCLTAVTMPINRALTSLPVELNKRRIFSYAHTVNSRQLLGNLKKNGVYGIYTDSLRP